MRTKKNRSTTIVTVRRHTKCNEHRNLASCCTHQYTGTHTTNIATIVQHRSSKSIYFNIYHFCIALVVIFSIVFLAWRCWAITPDRIHYFTMGSRKMYTNSTMLKKCIYCLRAVAKINYESIVKQRNFAWVPVPLRRQLLTNRLWCSLFTKVETPIGLNWLYRLVRYSFPGKHIQSILYLDNIARNK